MTMCDKYEDASNIDARVQLHVRFSENAYGWQRWVFDHLEPRLRGSILEIGCGPGYLWYENRARINKGWDIALADNSIGMVTEARSRLNQISLNVKSLVFDAVSIPFENESLDVMIANHVLFLVKDISQALEEVYRILKPGGLFFATTNGSDHLKELIDLFATFDPDMFGHLLEGEYVAKRRRFNLEKGHTQLSALFYRVELDRYIDGLVVDEVDVLVPWAEFWSKKPISNEERAEILKFLQQIMEDQGVIRISKASGIFVAEKANTA